MNMLRTALSDDGAESGSDAIHFNAKSEGTINLPGHGSIADAELLRDGQDLILRAPDGSKIVIDNYFGVEHPPLLASGDGAALTPQLVDSFVEPADGIQYAQKGSADDESPVGIVKESAGDATVTHPDGTVENITIGTPIYQGDIIETKGDGAINISFIDETTFAVSENARL